MTEFGSMTVGLYDRIAHAYAQRRAPDTRWAAEIHRALGDAESVVNVGAGTGSYEPADRHVAAVEPAASMIAARTSTSPIVRAIAEQLPFRDASFEAGLAIFTIHHWRDQERGLTEVARVVRGPIVIVTSDPGMIGSGWLGDYFPSVGRIDADMMPPLECYARWLHRPVEIKPLPVPHDCADGFCGAYWRRPRMYLDPLARAAISMFSMLPAEEVARGLAALGQDLDTGAWEKKYHDLLELDELDLGYRLLVSL
ncbi:MAG: class I SAM-dependent methyltransferase [Actinomycetota bacterium]